MTRILVIGDPVWDQATYLSQPARPGEYVPGTPLEGRPGGSAANVARALASAGHEVWIHGVVGDDEPGRLLREDLVRRGIQCDWLQTVPGPSRSCLLLVDLGGERQIIQVQKPGPAPQLLPRDFPPFGAVYVGDADPRMGSLLRQVIGRHPPHVYAHVGHKGLKAPPGIPVDYVLGSEHDLPEAWGGSPWPVLKTKLRDSLRALIITRGAEGVTFYDDEGVDVQGAADLKAVPIDSTGAGDSFAAGLIHTLGVGGSLEEAVRLGARWGAAATQVRASVPPPLEEVDRILVEHGNVETIEFLGVSPIH